ncbi:hypothetical protein [Desertihabitans brevis]|uniref:hypothetical protein n=1 Tax=Desertihabitans brevis TaxID=2268447 RepID=UPI0018F55ED3|nr:hypothetical protein [Desertihabitans brevis]
MSDVYRERDEADAQEQARDLDPATDPSPDAPERLPAEADPADVSDQWRDVPLDED